MSAIANSPTTAVDTTKTPPTAAVQQHALTKERIPPKTCVGLLHKGPYNEIGPTFRTFFQELNALKTTPTASTEGNNDDLCGCGGASTMDGKVLGLYLDNPQTTAVADLRSYAAMDVSSDQKTNDGSTWWPAHWETVHVDGGMAAVLTVQGPYTQLATAWKGFAPRVREQGWKFSSHAAHIPQEIYVDMDPKDDSKNVTKLVMFLQQEEE